MEATLRKQKKLNDYSYDVSLWCFKKFCNSVVMFLLLIVYVAKQTFDFICQLIVGGIILYFQLGVILVIVIWGLSWFLGKIGPHH